MCRIKLKRCLPPRILFVEWNVLRVRFAKIYDQTGKDAMNTRQKIHSLSAIVLRQILSAWESTDVFQWIRAKMAAETRGKVAAGHKPLAPDLPAGMAPVAYRRPAPAPNTPYRTAAPPPAPAPTFLPPPAIDPRRDPAFLDRAKRYALACEISYEESKSFLLRNDS